MFDLYVVRLRLMKVFDYCHIFNSECHKIITFVSVLSTYTRPYSLARRCAIECIQIKLKLKPCMILCGFFVWFSLCLLSAERVNCWEGCALSCFTAEGSCDNVMVSFSQKQET